MSKFRTGLDILASIAMIAVAGLMAWKILGAGSEPPNARIDEPSSIPLPGSPLSLGGMAIVGKPSASVALVVFSDFECPFCSSLANETISRLRSEFVDTGQLELAFQHFPLTRIHPSAMAAAIAADCAGEQGKFWEFHDFLFKNQDSLGSGAIEDASRELGLQAQVFESCRSDAANRAKVVKGLAEAKALGVVGTPTLFLGRIEQDGRVRVSKTLSGAAEYSYLSQAISALVK